MVNRYLVILHASRQRGLEYSVSRGDATKVATALYKYWEDKFPATNAALLH